uniref:Uncharacterized protein n=1 Tax=Fagus sylvatica TaxID=28930 RepID=A0A2N9F1B5_FAGSY
MPRTDVPQRELRGLTPHDITQHYASEWVTAFQMEGHQLTTCLPIRRILEGHVVRPEGIRNSSLSYSRDEQYTETQYYTFSPYFLKKLRLTKASEPPRPAPKPVPTPITLLSLAGLPARDLADCRPLISQQHQLAPSVGIAHFCLSPHQYKRTAWSGRDRWKSTLKPFPPVANLRKWRRWRDKCEILLPTFRSLHGRIRSSIRDSGNTRPRSRRKKTREKNKERGDAESRQERHQEQQQEQQEQRQEQEGETRGENTRVTVEQPSAKWEEEIKAMRAQMGEMKDEFKGRATKNIDDLVQGTDSPFTEKVISFPLPSKFRMPSLEIFDGSKDPLDHLESFKTVMCLQGVPDEIMCRAFPTTLKGPARIWFKKLMPGSVGSFAQLSRLFFNHFIGGQRYGRPTTHLLNVKQKEGETLRSYLTRFNKETLLVDGADDKVVLTAFISGLQSEDFLFSIYKDPPSTMTEIMPPGKKRKGDHADRPAEPHETRPKAQRNRNGRQEERSGRGFNERFNRFTPLNAPVDHIFMQIRNDPALKWPGKLLTDPDKRPRDKYCRFHRDHGHNTENCYDLKRQIEELIKQGKLQRFIEKGQREGRPQGARQQRPPGEAPPRPPLGEIHVITGGMAAGGTSRSSRKAYARQIYNVLVTQKSNKKPRVEDLPITFTEEDACKVFHPHNDALVVTMEIAGYSTRRVLIDNGSSADIIYLTAFRQMKIDKDKLQPIETPLVGFAGTSIYPLGMVTLQIVAGTHPKQAMKKREMKGDQAMARECYLTTVNAEQVHQTLIMEERQNVAEPTEELEEIVLIEGDEKKTTRIGTSMAKEIRASVVSFLRENADVFAWSHDDMPGISTEVISHKLNVNPSTPPVKQKRRVFAPERNTAVMEEVDKLLKAGFIREVYYPEWLANVIQMTEGDQEKTAFITSRGLFCYKVMPFGLKNAGATYQRLVNKMFHDQIGRNVEVYVDDMLRGIEANPDKIKAILDMSPPKTIKEVQSLTGKAAALNRKAMNKPDAAGRHVQWSIEMSEFHIDYRPRTAIKAQALADFIAEFTQPWKDEEDSEEGRAWTVNIDGSSTKEMSGAGVVLVSPEKDKFEYALQLCFRATNNEAEYEALLAGLKLSKSMGIENLTVKSDSQLIVGQVKGEYEAKEDRMKKYLMVVKNLLTQFKKVELLQIPREENEAADRLARLASSGVEIDGFVEIQGRPSTEKETINPISSTTTWMLPIIRYLKEGTLPADRAEAHKLRIQEANYVIREVHEGVCGNHSGARSLAHKLTRAGYYWPSLLHDATQFVKACDKCQHIMGPFPVGTKQAKFLVVAIDYFTKWVEAEPLATISEKNVKSFVWKAVICRFGIPRVLISDNGKQFDNGPFRELCAQLNIRNHYSSPRHPQANGQVEVTNRTLLKQIKTRLEGAKGMWVEELPSVLWAYRTTVRTPTKETPFKLTYGTEGCYPRRNWTDHAKDDLP